MLTNAKLVDEPWTRYTTQFTQNPEQGVYVHLWSLMNLVERDTVLDFWPDQMYTSSYGTVDSVEQGLRIFRSHLEQEGRYFCIAFNCIRKQDQPPKDGWRFSKNGPYLGEKKLLYHSYLYDEPDIDEVWMFEIIELKPPAEEIPLLQRPVRPQHLYRFITDEVRPNFPARELEEMRLEAEELERRVEAALAADTDPYEIDTSDLKHI